MAPLVCLLASVTIIGAYLSIYLACVGRLPESISETYYQVTHKWFFSATVFCAVACATPWLFELTPEKYQFLAFFIIGGLLFVAAAPAFRDDFQSKVHIGGAIVAGVACLIYIILESGIPLIALIIGAFGLVFRRYWCFFLEAGLLTNLYVILFEKCIKHLIS